MAVAPGTGGGFYGKRRKWKRGVQGPAVFRGRGLFGGLQTQAASAPPGGGSNPYAGLIADYLNQQRADFAAASAADAASRDAALRRYIISYGEVPDLDALGISKDARGFLEKALDPKTRELAAKNMAAGTAIKARMAHANEIAQRRIPAGLAARGMLRSGQTGSDLAEQAQQYKIQGFDTLNELLGNVEGTVGNFLQAERDRQRALAEAAMQASMNAYGDWGGDYLDGPSGPSGPGGISTVYRPPRLTGPGTQRPQPSRVTRGFLQTLGRRYRPPRRQRISGVQY